LVPPTQNVPLRQMLQMHVLLPVSVQLYFDTRVQPGIAVSLLNARPWQ
jgi:hypothetical protein